MAGSSSRKHHPPEEHGNNLVPSQIPHSARPNRALLQKTHHPRQTAARRSTARPAPARPAAAATSSTVCHSPPRAEHVQRPPHLVRHRLRRQRPDGGRNPRLNAPGVFTSGSCPGKNGRYTWFQSAVSYPFTSHLIDLKHVLLKRLCHGVALGIPG